MPDGRKNRAGTYYALPEQVDAQRLEVLVRTSHADVYIATKDEIVASGIATADMLPGEPGRALTSATYRPLGVERAGSAMHLMPGYLQISRRLDGRYRVTLTVSGEEQQRRAAEQQQQREKEKRLAATTPDAGVGVACAANAFRVRMMRKLFDVGGIVDGRTVDDRGVGLSLDAESVAKVRGLICELNECIMAARVEQRVDFRSRLAAQIGALPEERFRAFMALAVGTPAA